MKIAVLILAAAALATAVSPAAAREPGDRGSPSGQYVHNGVHGAHMARRVRQPYDAFAAPRPGHDELAPAEPSGGFVMPPVGVYW
jgi:hypothetical protein